MSDRQMSKDEFLENEFGKEFMNDVNNLEISDLSELLNVIYSAYVYAPKDVKPILFLRVREVVRRAILSMMENAIELLVIDTPEENIKYVSPEDVNNITKKMDKKLDKYISGEQNKKQKEEYNKDNKDNEMKYYTREGEA